MFILIKIIFTIVYVTQQDVIKVLCVGYTVIAKIVDEVDEILVLQTHTTKQQMHIYNYFELYVIIFHKKISVPLVSYNKNTINIQLMVQKCTIKPIHVVPDFYSNFLK